MKSWTAPCVAFLITSLVGYFAAHGLLRQSGPVASAPVATVAKQPATAAPAARSSVRITAGTGPVDEDFMAMARRSLSGADGKELTEGERLKKTMRLANLASLDGEGRLQPGTVELLGLNESQAAQVQESFDRMRETLGKQIKARLEMGAEATAAELAARSAETKKSNPDFPVAVQRGVSFRIPAAPEEGRAVRDQLRDELTQIAGEGAAAVLMGNGDANRFGDYGKLEVRGNIETSTRAGQTEQAIRFQAYDADGNKVASVETSEAGMVRRSLGTALDDYLVEDKRW
ncbi:MAG: hypothetical protein JWO82_2132 [Akkermansiaceae bacterium]|nr:hypothetical protein [Akkermansiaceae bacterium]